VPEDYPVPDPVARSPIHQRAPSTVVAGWEVSTRRSVAQLRLADWTPMAKVLVRADGSSGTARALGVGFRRAQRRADRVLVVGSGPDEWLLLGPPGAAARLVQDATADPAVDPAGNDAAGAGAGGLVSVVDVTHGRALVRITGVDSPRALAKVCAIDLRDRSTPDGTAFRSTAGKLTVDVVRDDVDVTGSSVRVPSYLLHCERSTGQDLFDLLLDAGAEFGIDVDGFEPDRARRPPAPGGA
jgi:heterotetrameric sarcosine oxidase gamma subunit